MGPFQKLSGAWRYEENKGLLQSQPGIWGSAGGNEGTCGDQVNDLCQLLALSFSRETVQSTSNSRRLLRGNSRNSHTEMLRELYQRAPLFARAHVTRILIPRSYGR